MLCHSEHFCSPSITIMFQWVAEYSTSLAPPLTALWLQLFISCKLIHVLEHGGGLTRSGLKVLLLSILGIIMEHEEILSWAGMATVLSLAGLSPCPWLTRKISLKESLVQTVWYFTLGMIHFLRKDQRPLPFSQITFSFCLYSISNLVKIIKWIF